MIESGVNPEALAVRSHVIAAFLSAHVTTVHKAVIQELRREAAALNGQIPPTSDGR